MNFRCKERRIDPPDEKAPDSYAAGINGYKKVGK
jgi:hypothetical protein